MSVLAIMLVVYALVALAVVRPVAGHFAWRFVRMERYDRRSEPSGEFWLGATCIALMAGVLWPLVAAMLVLGRVRIGEERKALEQQESGQVLAPRKRRLGLTKGWD